MFTAVTPDAPLSTARIPVYVDTYSQTPSGDAEPTLENPLVVSGSKKLVDVSSTPLGVNTPTVLVVAPGVLATEVAPPTAMP